jgi:hypothetical protein
MCSRPFETRSLSQFARRYHRGFTFYACHAAVSASSEILREQAGYSKNASDELQSTYQSTDVEAIRFQVRRLLPLRPCVSTGAVERINVSLFTSSWA